VAFAVIDSLEKHCETVTKPEMTSDLEKEMDEIAAGKRKQREVVDKSCTDLKQIMELLFKHKESVAIELRTALRFSEVMGKCSCGANLVVRRGKSGKRFVGCSSYPNCTITYPLPQKGFITPLNEYCPECKAPTIQVKNGRFNYKMCLNMVCVTKKDWIKKAQEKKEAVQAKEAVGKQIESKSSESKLAETNKANEKVIETKFGSVPSFPGPAVAPVIKVSIPEVALNLDSSKKVSLKKEVKPRIVKKEPKPKKSKVKKVESVVVKGKAK
jgi:DNA topoisomerase-1